MKLHWILLTVAVFTIVNTLLNGFLIQESLYLVEFIVNEIAIEADFSIHNKFGIGIAASTIILCFGQMFRGGKQQKFDSLESFVIGAIMSPVSTKVLIILIVGVIISILR